VTIARNRIIGDRIVERAPRIAGAPATMMQFPIGRQRDVIDKIAAAVVRKRSANAADYCIGKALRAFVDEMRGRGIPQATVKREVHMMETLIRAAVWRLMFPWSETEQLPRRRPRREIQRRGARTLGEQLVFSFEDER
jgi:hypothetical protein